MAQSLDPHVGPGTPCTLSSFSRPRVTHTRVCTVTADGGEEARAGAQGRRAQGPRENGRRKERGHREWGCVQGG